MRIEVAMPRLSDSMSEGSVTSWFKNEGDVVSEGEAIAEIETEKSTVDLLAPHAGVLARIVVAAGSGGVTVGALLAEIETEASTAKGPRAVPFKAKGAEPTPVVAAVPKPSKQEIPPVIAVVPKSAPSSTVAEDAEIAATPLARRMAAQSGLALSALTRTGIGGKVCKADVEAALGRRPSLSVVPQRAAAAAAPGVAMPVSRVRRTIAERMTRAKATIPHFYLSVDCRVDRLLDVRGRLKADGLSVSINDFVVRAAALALRRDPRANASWNDDGTVIQHDRIDIAVAVSLDDGLVTPVIRGVDALGLAAIGDSVRDLASRAREGKLVPHEYDGATFTISNLGMHGVGEMFAIINPPQACILGVGAAEPRPVVEDGQVVAGTVMTLSLSADHRVLDGATGAALLATIRRLLEEPARMLV